MQRSTEQKLSQRRRQADQTFSNCILNRLTWPKNQGLGGPHLPRKEQPFQITLMPAHRSEMAAGLDLRGCHYQNRALCRVLGALPRAIYRALGKVCFAECHTRRTNTTDLVCRAQNTRYRHTLGKKGFVEYHALDET